MTVLIGYVLRDGHVGPPLTPASYWALDSDTRALYRPVPMPV